MKFKIRFIDQIVGFFIILSLVCIALVVIMLGRSQRWLAKDISFVTALPSATGLSKNLAIQYRGFTIGNIKSFQLREDDYVEVIFTIHEEYRDRVRKGSLVEMLISPIGLCNQFLFHPGKGELLDEGAFIPVSGSAQARELVRQGLAVEPQHDDSINLIMSRAMDILNDASGLIANLNEAIGAGSDETEIGLIVGSVQKTMQMVEHIPQTVDLAVVTVVKLIENVQTDLNSILANLNGISAELNDPDNLLYSVLDTEKDVYINLIKSLNSVSGILYNLDRTTAFIPGQLPQVAALITDLRLTLRQVEDVMTALTNNPLLRGGIPERPETHGIGPRGISF